MNKITQKISNLSLKYKIVVLVTFIGSIALILSMLLFFYFDYKEFIFAKKHELETYSKIFAANNAAAIYFEDKFNSTEYLSSIENSRTIKKVILYKLNKRTNLLKEFVAHPTTALDTNFNFTLYTGLDSVWRVKNKISIFKPVIFKSISANNPELIGGIYMEAQIPIKLKLIRYLKIFIFIFLISSVFALFLTLRLQNLVTEPIFKIQDMVRKVKDENNFAIRASIINEDEIGSLAIGVNNMLEHIEKQNSELIIAKEEALELLKVKEQFLANMSHEIRTPMNAILGMTNILLDTNMSVEQLKYLKNIKISAGNLLVIINDILDFSKLKTGNVKLEKIPFDLSKLVSQVIQTLQFSSEKKGLNLSYIIEDNLHTHIIGDPTRLNQILLNIIQNGIKFTSQGSVKLHVFIHKKVSESKNIISFRIIDTGIGIRKEKLETIFESFQQESLETTRKYGGTGLGLSISKQLIELQGGKISVQSTVGKGSIFTILLPYEINQKPNYDLGDEISDSMKEQVAKMKVLLAEDNPLNQIVASQVLKKYNINFTVASDGEEAINFINDKEFDALLLDLHMPKIDGYSVAKYIREEKKNQDIIIIALTAAATKAEIDKCYAVKMDSFVSKPFREIEIIKALLKDAIAKPTNHIEEFKSNTSHVDLTYLKTMSGGDKIIILQMVKMFKEQIPEYLSELKKSLQKKDYKNLSESAHKTKSSLNIVGMNDLADLMKSLELKAKRNEDIDTFQKMIDEFAKALNICILELDEKINLL